MREVKKLKKELGGDLRENEILAPYTTFKIGGPARYFYVAQDNLDFIKAIKIANKLNIPYFILGGGSNILFSDNGFNGMAIKRRDSRSSKDFGMSGEKITASANVALGVLVQFAAQAGLSGLEWAMGIPGTIAGAVIGNAGAYGGEIADIVESVEVLSDNYGKTAIINKKGLNFSYRNSIFKKNKKYVILSIVLKLKKGKKTEIKHKIKNILNNRIKALPLQYPSAGCIFKNPSVRDKKILMDFQRDTGKEPKKGRIPAGYLIDSLGLKGKKMGQALIGDKNANFILNTGGATAENVVMLISYIKQQVRDNYGIQLKEEIELVGF